MYTILIRLLSVEDGGGGRVFKTNVS